MSKHQNNGSCKRCLEIIDRYPEFYLPLRSWFIEFQRKNYFGHVSCAGRGEQDQEDCFQKGSSLAHWGQSAHNYNAALDLFEMQGDQSNIYERVWFQTVLVPALTPDVQWYGDPKETGGKFVELPHVQWRTFKQLRDQKVIHLVGEGSETVVVTVTGNNPPAPIPPPGPGPVMIPTTFSTEPPLYNSVAIITTNDAPTQPIPLNELIPSALATPIKSKTFCQRLSEKLGRKK